MKRTILVTGSTDGIGFATAKELLLKGHNVLVHGRTEEKARLALGKIFVQAGLKEDPKNPVLIPVWGDLSVMTQVVELARQVGQMAPELDVLINNAGIYMKERVVTIDGFETTFAVNHLSVQLLTHHLLPILKSRTSARIITVSSIAHQKGKLNLDDLQAAKRFDGYEAYATSKLCNVLFSRCLAALTKSTSVTVNCLHPGVINTKLLRAGFSIQGDTVERGAETSVMLAIDPLMGKMTGGYYINGKVSIPSRWAQDDKLAVKLWRKSEELLKSWL
jgi:NAD(P)-dependent dehydrogenase (short-subunit alcohol dehydrogenase family)